MTKRIGIIVILCLVSSFQALASTQDAVSPFALKMRELVKIQMSGDIALKKYDLLLENDAVEPMHSIEYAKLQVIHEMSHELRDEILDLLMKAHSGEDLRVFRELKDIFTQQAYGVDPILWPEVEGLIADFHQKLGQNYPGRLDLARVLGPMFSELELDNKYFSKISAITSEEVIRFDLDEKFNSKVALTHTELSSVKFSRRRNARPCYSYSSGKSGNIIGSKFPSGTWALTFDDGPHSSRSAKIARLFQRRGVSTTFFWLAKLVKAMPGKVSQIENLGSNVACHSYDHKNVSRLSASGKRRQIGSATGSINRLTSNRIKFFRLPYGAGVNNKSVRREIARSKLIHVFWNVDSLDWKDKNSASIARRVNKLIKRRKSGLILFHDIHKRTIDASSRVLNYISQRGGTVKNLSDIVEVRTKCN